MGAVPPTVAPQRVRDVTPADVPEIARIYNHYVEHTVITFEVDPVSTQAMMERVATVQAKRLPWLVWVEEARVLGYAYATTFRDRAAYRHTVETTVYLDPEATGRGGGGALYDAILDQLEKRGVRLVVGGIALPNAASVALHESRGFGHVGTFTGIGRKHGRWIDVGFWQKQLAGPADPDVKST